jgi:hypothetical protein
MTYNPRKKVTKIFNQINKIAQKGRDYKQDYNKFIDDIVNKGDYAHFEMCLTDYYNLDPIEYKNVQEMKSKTWEKILFETDDILISGLKKLYRANNLYQQGYEIRSDSSDYTILTVAGGINEHYPFKEERLVMSESWNNKVERYKYTQVATSSQISISKDSESGIQIELLDPMVYQIDISKVIWATYSVGMPSTIIESPYELNVVHSIQPIGTQSYIDQINLHKTTIPTTHGGDYLITIRRRGDTGWLSPELKTESYSYKVYIRKENLLGTIKELDYYDPESKYLILNQKFAQLTGLKRTFIEVMKTGSIEPIIIIYDNINI